MGKRIAILLILITGFILEPVTAAAADDPLILGVFPRRNLTITIKLYTPLARYLSAELKREVILVSSRNFPNFWKGVQQRRYDIVHYNQYHYVKSRRRYGYQVILKNEEFGRSKIAAAIGVRKDSGINSLRNLRGQTIIFGGGKQAMVSYIMATYLLRKAGLKAGQYQEIFAINPPNAMIATYFGKAKASGVGDIVHRLPSVRQKIDTDQMRYIAIGKAYAHLPWAVKHTMPPALRHKIQRVLTNLDKTERGRAILKRAGLTDLAIATDREYNPHRWIIYRVLGEKY